MQEAAPTRRFSDRADDYARYRPTYPPSAIDAILHDLPPASGLIAADIGAGTGISSRLLADRGVRVLAIEPNASMRQAAEPHPNVEFLDGVGERTGLADASVDLILAAQAFHWLDPERACAEFQRVLKPRGRVALMWNDRDRSEAFSDGYYEVV